MDLVQFVSNCNWLLWWILDNLFENLLKDDYFRIWGTNYQIISTKYIQYHFVLHYYSIFIQLHPERMDVLILSISKCVKEEQRRAFFIFSTTFVFMKERVIFFVKTIYKNFYIYLSLNCFSAVCTIAYISLVKYLVHNH